MNEREAIRRAAMANPKMARKFLEAVKSGKLKVGDPEPDEELQVLCVRWPGLVDDCSREKCMICAMDVAIAPSTRELVAKHRAAVQYLCMDCMTQPVN